MARDDDGTRPAKAGYKDAAIYGVFALIAAVIGVSCGWMAWHDWKVFATGTASPASVRLADLRPIGESDNSHICVTDLQFGREIYIHYHWKSGRQDSVWIPLISDGRLCAMVRTPRGQTPDDLDDFLREPTVTGVLASDWRFPIEYWRTPELRQSYPGVDFGRLPIVLEGYSFPQVGLLLWLTAISIVALASAMATSVFAVRSCLTRPRPTAASDIPTAAARSLAAELARGSDLGEVRRVFVRSKHVVGVAVFSAFAATLMAGGLCFGPPAKSVIHVAGYVMMVPVEMLTVAVLYMCIAHRHDSTILFANGLVTRNGAKSAACTWAEVEAASGLGRLKIEMMGSTTYMGGPVCLHCPGGRTVTVGTLTDEIDLVTAIRDQVLPRLVTETVETIKKGAPVVIGKLTIDRSGIAGPNGAWLPWAEACEAVQHGEKLLMVIRQGVPPRDWTTVDLMTPNVDVLPELVAIGKRGELG